MFVGVLKLDLRLPQARSLKDRRSAVQRLLSLVRGRCQLSCAEVDCSNLRQRAAVAVCAVSDSESVCERLLQEALDVAQGCGFVELVNDEAEMIEV